MNNSHSNVVPCVRDAWPDLDPFFDLSQNFEAARAIFEAIDPFFRFEAGESKFSGYARRTSPRDGKGPSHFYVQIWEDEETLYRTVGFRGIGYQGILHVEMVDEGRIDGWRDDDPRKPK